MKEIKVIPVIWVDGENASFTEKKENISSFGAVLSILKQNGASRVLAIDASSDQSSHEAGVSAIKELAKSCGLGIFSAGHIGHFDDVKKYLYAGACGVIFNEGSDSEMKIYAQALPRFSAKRAIRTHGFESPVDAAAFAKSDDISAEARAFAAWSEGLDYDMLFIRVNAETDILKLRNALGDTSEEVTEKESQAVPALKWEDLKTNSDGLVPCIVQDYVTGEVLMMAYMDKAAYEETLSGGLMCYYSRSRKMRWLKGETSGCYQHVKSLTADCDRDTLLAKVDQIGGACHTGAHSCFFYEIADFGDEHPSDPMKIFESVYATLLDRRENPKEGSYTNYLYSKGIDKILKKCGEEASEIIIAAKNNNSEEIVYEISDFLYHLMVMMAYKGIDWSQIVDELTRREG